MNLQELQQLFVDSFGRSPAGGVRAPGRVNLIGEHTDYNGGFVLPIAIERDTVALFAPRSDRRVNFISLQAPGPAISTGLDEPISPGGSPKWASYCRGVLAVLREKGVALAGADVLLSSTVPLGGGLSSSASMEVAIAMALMHAAGAAGALSGRELALACQRAENVYAQAPCGIMDQSIAVLGRAGHAMLMDCRDGQVRQVPFDDPGIVLLVADTQVKHSIGDGGYPARREQCAQAARSLGVPFLRETGADVLAAAQAGGKLAGKELMRARHVIGEIDRTLRAVDALGRKDYAAFGQLMYASHRSLRDDFEVSCDELDAIVDQAAACDGVYGARMTGGGFGGCAIVLVRAEAAAQVSAAITKDFARRFGRACPVFATRAADGAGVLFPK